MSQELIPETMALRRAGLSASQIGAKIGLSRNAVLGAVFRFRNPEHCRAYDRDKRPRKTARVNYQERNAEMAHLRACGWKLRDIGDIFGIAPSSVCKVFERAAKK